MCLLASNLLVVALNQSWVRPQFLVSIVEDCTKRGISQAGTIPTNKDGPTVFSGVMRWGLWCAMHVHRVLQLDIT
jgi:hypothetical protein